MRQAHQVKQTPLRRKFALSQNVQQIPNLMNCVHKLNHLRPQAFTPDFTQTQSVRKPKTPSRKTVTVPVHAQPQRRCDEKIEDIIHFQ